MSTQNHVVERHGRDRLKDALFIGVAVLIAGLAIGSVTTKAQPKPPEWGLTVLEQPSIGSTRRSRTRRRTRRPRPTASR